jgi:hypothetical protein
MKPLVLCNTREEKAIISIQVAGGMGRVGVHVLMHDVPEIDVGKFSFYSKENLVLQYHCNLIQEIRNDQHKSCEN